ncbi:MAG: heat shock protein HspQ [Myxococcota bacterium]|nr:heat shock protein HspQ [Myxococcota bacterium]
MAEDSARFSVGDLVHHRLFDYRGVVFDVDPCFEGTEEWYEQVARSRPPRDAPWYHVLVDGATHTTYVAERNLEAAESHAPIAHPLLDHLFASFSGGRYVLRERPN